MNYQRIYDSIINNAKSLEYIRIAEKKQKLNYFERHHIIPRCLGGSDEKENLVLLTAKEHYLCHRLLCAVYPNSPKLQYAMWAMVNRASNGQYRHKISAKTYEYIKQLYSIRMSNRLRSNHPRPNLGKKFGPRSEEIRKKIGDSQRGKSRKPKTPEEIEKTIKHLRGKPLSIEHRAKIGQANAGKKASAEAIALRTESRRLNKLKKINSGEYVKIQCPHCLKYGYPEGMYTHHFDNCKFKK